MEKKEKVIRIIRYVVSIFIYLIALGCFANKWFLSGIILVLSGTILLPILDDLLKFKHKRLIEVLATIILFILGMAITPASKEGYNNTISENALLNTNEIVNSTNEIDNDTNNDNSKSTQILTSTSNSDSNSNKQSTENNNSQSKTQSETQTQTQTQAQTQTTTTSQTEQK